MQRYSIASFFIRKLSLNKKKCSLAKLHPYKNVYPLFPLEFILYLFYINIFSWVKICHIILFSYSSRNQTPVTYLPIHIIFILINIITLSVVYLQLCDGLIAHIIHQMHNATAVRLYHRLYVSNPHLYPVVSLSRTLSGVPYFS